MRALKCAYTSARSALQFPLFVEFQHGCARGDFDFAVDDGALRDGDRACADLAAYHGGVADFQFVPDGETPCDLAGDHGMLRVDEAVPASRDGQVEGALQIPIAVDLAGNHEMSGAADVADEDGLGAYKCRGCRITFQEPPFLLSHGSFLPHFRPAVM